MGNVKINIIKPMTPELTAALQAVADQFQVEINGTVTPVSTPVVFEIKPTPSN